MIPFQKVIQKLRNRIDAGDEQMVAGAGAGDVEQMSLSRVDFLKIGIVGT